MELTNEVRHLCTTDAITDADDAHECALLVDQLAQIKQVLIICTYYSQPPINSMQGGYPSPPPVAMQALLMLMLP
jgi:hypothetical protein